LIKDKRGDPEGAVVVFKDLTRIEQMAEQQKLKDRLMAIGQMAVGFAHEIRNPLASIEFTVSRLKRKLNDATEERALLDKVLSETVRLNSTISHALDFVKPLKPELKCGHIHDVLDRCVARARKEFETRKIKFTREYAMDIDPFLMDEGQLDQVFLNLIVNAVESIHHEAGRILVSTEVLREFPCMTDPADKAEDDPGDISVRIKISDNGRGIRKEDSDRIFLPFFTTKESGSGLGLARAQKIIDMHGGQIDLESRPDRGTVFRVKLPVRL
jgi:nitrogen-specific signal transduction histidine kinase